MTCSGELGWEGAGRRRLHPAAAEQSQRETEAITKGLSARQQEG